MATGGHLLDKPALLPTTTVPPSTATIKDTGSSYNHIMSNGKNMEVGTVNGSFVADPDVRRRGSSNQV